MISRLAIGAILFLLTGCGLSSLPHGNLPMPDMSGGPGFGSSPLPVSTSRNNSTTAVRISAI
jgi:hypothetical protein